MRQVSVAGCLEYLGGIAIVVKSVGTLFRSAKDVQVRRAHGVFLALAVMMSVAVRADLIAVRQVIVSSKTGPATANIGPVNLACDIEMKEARVDITVGEPQNERKGLVLVETRAVFRMANTSSHGLVLTVGFPISDSEYSAFKLTDFNVTSNGEGKTVFNRVTGYPGHVEHSWVSGPHSSPDVLPDADSTPGLFGEHLGDLRNKTAATGDVNISGGLPSHGGLPLGRGKELVIKPVLRDDRSAVVQNLMVWREDFSPNEERSIEVRFSVEIPSQRKKSAKKRIESAGKGILKEEANNCPPDFLKTLKPGRFYFFDYFLTTGASWKGPIGSEIIALHLPEYWREQRLYCSKPDRLKQSDPLTWVYTLTNEEPQENLYFALPKKTKR